MRLAQDPVSTHSYKYDILHSTILVQYCIMAWNALQFALEQYSKFKTEYIHKICGKELSDIKCQVRPVEIPECTVAHEKAFNELLRIVVSTYPGTVPSRTRIRAKVEEDALNGVGSRLKEDYQRNWLYNARFCGQVSQDRLGIRAHRARTLYERLWWMVAIVRIAVNWKLSEEDVARGILSDCSDARAVLEEAFEVVAMSRVLKFRREMLRLLDILRNLILSYSCRSKVLLLLLEIIDIYRENIFKSVCILAMPFIALSKAHPWYF